MEQQSDILIYQSEDGITRIETRLENETVWLTQAQMAELFQKGRTTITEHIKHIFEEGELEEAVVCRKFRHTTQHGAINEKTQEREVKYYNLDVIISVGYRVRSHQGTKFRQWATARLREYIVKGFTMNDELLKEAGGGNYFDELFALNRKPMYMKDWVIRLDEFLNMTGNEVLQHAGTVSNEQALRKAEIEYARYKERTQNELSKVEKDFVAFIDTTAKGLKNKNK